MSSYTLFTDIVSFPNGDNNLKELIGRLRERGEKIQIYPSDCYALWNSDLFEYTGINSVRRALQQRLEVIAA